MRSFQVYVNSLKMESSAGALNKEAKYRRSQGQAIGYIPTEYELSPQLATIHPFNDDFLTVTEKRREQI